MRRAPRILLCWSEEATSVQSGAVRNSALKGTGKKRVRDLLPLVREVGVQLFLGCARSRMAKESITSMPDIARRPMSLTRAHILNKKTILIKWVRQRSKKEYTHIIIFIYIYIIIYIIYNISL